MSVLVVGAGGATGWLLVEQLFDQGEPAKAVVRSANSLPEHLIRNVRLIITEASLLEMTDKELEAQVPYYGLAREVRTDGVGYWLELSRHMHVALTGDNIARCRITGRSAIDPGGGVNNNCRSECYGCIACAASSSVDQRI